MTHATCKSHLYHSNINALPAFLGAWLFVCCFFVQPLNATESMLHRQDEPCAQSTNAVHPMMVDGLLEELVDCHGYNDKIPHFFQQFSSRLSFNCSMGFGKIWYQNDIAAMRFLEGKGDAFFLVTPNHQVYRPHWFYAALSRVEDMDVNQVDAALHAPARSIEFRASGCAYPLTFFIQYSRCTRWFLGLGREMVFAYLSSINHKNDNGSYRRFPIPNPWHVQGRWFVQCGRYFPYRSGQRFFADMRLGYVHHLGSMFSSAIVSLRYLNDAIVCNIGVGYLRPLTSYLSWTARLALDFQRFKECLDAAKAEIRYTQPAVCLQMGLSITGMKKSRHAFAGVAPCKKNSPIQGTFAPAEHNELLDLT